MKTDIKTQMQAEKADDVLANLERKHDSLHGVVIPRQGETLRHYIGICAKAPKGSVVCCVIHSVFTEHGTNQQSDDMYIQKWSAIAGPPIDIEITDEQYDEILRTLKRDNSSRSAQQSGRPRSQDNCEDSFALMPRKRNVAHSDTTNVVRFASDTQKGFLHKGEGDCSDLGMFHENDLS